MKINNEAFMRNYVKVAKEAFMEINQDKYKDIENLQWAKDFLNNYEKRVKTPKPPRIDSKPHTEDLPPVGRYAPTQLIKTSVRALKRDTEAL